MIFEPYDEYHLEIILEVTNEPNIMYVGCDKNLDVPELLKKFKFVVIGLNHIKVGSETCLADRIHQLGYKAASSVINPVPENPVKKLNDLIQMGFDYIYVDGIPYTAIDMRSE